MEETFDEINWNSYPRCDVLLQGMLITVVYWPLKKYDWLLYLMSSILLKFFEKTEVVENIIYIETTIVQSPSKQS